MEEALSVGAFVVQPKIETDDAFVAEAAKADPQAFGDLYERYYARVYRYVYHRVGSPSDAEDITGLVFMKALEALPSYQSKRKSFAPWLFRITHNAVVDHYRRQRKQSNLEEVDPQVSDADPIGDVLGSERRRELRSLIDDLSRDQREVILMRYGADLTFPEIASLLKKNEPAVRMLLHRGLRRLKAVLDDE